jgi:hypothetical protein
LIQVLRTYTPDSMTMLEKTKQHMKVLAHDHDTDVFGYD